MPNEYIDRIMRESPRPLLTPEGYRESVAQLANELPVLFAQRAMELSYNGDQLIYDALDELSQRLDIMGSCIQPRVAPHNVNNLLSFVEIARPSAAKLSGVQTIDILQYRIVHTPDRLRELMEEHRLITHRGERLLKKLDRESPYYRQPDPELETIEKE